MNPSSPSLIDAAVSLAEQWQHRANQLRTAEEQQLQQQLQRLLTHPRDKILLTRIIDQSFRSPNPRRVADQLDSLLRDQGLPGFLRPLERFVLGLWVQVGPRLGALAIPALIRQLRASCSQVIIPGEPGQLQAHLHRRRAQGVRMNLNHLGEAVLGEQEAAHRLATYIKDMEDPEIDYISIKISTLSSQISSLAFDETVAILKERLSTLYRAANSHHSRRPDGSLAAKFVNLDMEEYRDLALTTRVFIATLEQEEFFRFSAGMVLQAYLPDSFAIQQQLTAWARQRLARGGAPIKLRIVKGANLEMERLEAALHNWPLAPYDHKLAVDANYKRMVAFGMEPDNINAVHLGIASHNLFDLAYAATLARARGVEQWFCFEMLEGMADPVRRALQEGAGEVLLYAPVAARDEFINAIGYLIRRLDENTGPENFLRFAPNLQVDSSQWRLLKEGFLRSCALQETVAAAPHRTQDRTAETWPQDCAPPPCSHFVNEPDTDWSLAANRRWATAIRDRWMRAPGCLPLEIPLVIGGEEIFTGRETRACFDPSQPGIQIAQAALATIEDSHRALRLGADDPEGWRALSAPARRERLARVTRELRRARGDLIGAACAETGKVFAEADAEVSEAIDFSEFYPYSLAVIHRQTRLQTRGKGVILVIAPWNFPIAIPCGGICAALAAGNTVLFKPSSEAILTGWLLCQCFWRAGISKKVLQFLPCAGATVGPELIASPLVDAVILTGGTETGLAILAQRPGLALSAETGGKNATIVTDMADRDQAIKHVLHSAFSNSGQKCSATSLLILEAPLYDDPHFRQQLVDAAASLPVGSAWRFTTRVGPLIRPPSGPLLRALTTLEPGEDWALKPAMADDNPRLWSPGIKYGVRANSFTHRTELFGPLLGVMRAETLEAAIALVNGTGYGLTSGLESLDGREQSRWQQAILAGNLYINRPTTGALVLRQPFGGLGKSVLGPGLKAGGPDYVLGLLDCSECAPPPVEAIATDHRLLQLAAEWQRGLLWGRWPELRLDLEQTVGAIASYLQQMEARFGRDQDFCHLRGQDNLLRYRPISPLVIRLHPDDRLFATLAQLAAATLAGCQTVLSLPPHLTNPVIDFLDSPPGQRLLQGVIVRRQSDEALAAEMPTIGRLRYAAPDRVPALISAVAARTGVYIAREPVLMEGRIELLHYFHQQTLCHNYHRYGNLGDRSLD